MLRIVRPIAMPELNTTWALVMDVPVAAITGPADRLARILFIGGLAITVAVLAGYVLPQFKPLFEELNADLPLPTRMLLGVATLMAAVPVWLAWASWRGKVRIRCCGVAACDDLRMRPAFEQDASRDRAGGPPQQAAGPDLQPASAVGAERQRTGS